MPLLGVRLSRLWYFCIYVFTAKPTVDGQ